MSNENSNDYPVQSSAFTGDAADQVLCNTCEHEVPVSEAVVAEAVDYKVYFCGLDCYERWRAQADR